MKDHSAEKQGRFIRDEFFNQIVLSAVSDQYKVYYEIMDIVEYPISSYDIKQTLKRLEKQKQIVKKTYQGITYYKRS